MMEPSEPIILVLSLINLLKPSAFSNLFTLDDGRKMFQLPIYISVSATLSRLRLFLREKLVVQYKPRKMV